MNQKKTNEMLNQEILFIHSILEKADFEMELLALIDEILKELLKSYPFTGVNLGIINEQDKLIIHDVSKRVLPNLSQEVKDHFQRHYTQEVDYHVNPMWVCLAIREDREIYEPEIVVEKMPEETREYFRMLAHKSLYILPMKLGDQIYGFLYLADNTKNMTLSEDEKKHIRRTGSLICKIIEIHRTHERIRKQNRQLETEIQLAARIQKEILPKNYPESSFCTIRSDYLPMISVGGDYFDFILPKPKEFSQFGFFIADVSGHGVSAAFITSMLKMSLHSEEVKNQAHHPVQVLQLINQALLNKTAGNFVTAFYAFFDFKTWTLRYASAGHNPFFQIVPEEKTLNEFHAKGKFLGLFETLNLEEKSIPISPGQRLFFYTDGLTEAVNPEEFPFEPRLRDVLCQSAGDSAEELSKKVIRELKQFIHFDQKKELDDDVALVIFDLHPETFNSFSS